MKLYPDISEGNILSEMDLGYHVYSLEKVIGLCFRFFSDPNAAVRLSDFYNDDKEFIDYCKEGIDEEPIEEEYINDLYIKKQETVPMENPEDIKKTYESVYYDWEEAISERIKVFDDKLKKESDSIFPGFMSHDHLIGLKYDNNSEQEDPVRKTINSFRNDNEDLIKRLEEKMKEVIAILLSTT